MGLDELRRELADIDRQLLALVARRQSLSISIGDEKRRLGRTTRDFRQERDVIERARDAAAAVGVNGDVAEELVLTLIRASLTAQEQHGVVSSETGSGKRALVIGGAGKMGAWFARFLHSQGFDTVVADPGGGVSGCGHVEDWTALELTHDVIVVATPLAKTAEILGKLGDRKPSGVVFDIGSLKGPLREAHRSLVAAGVMTTSLHPMFGPDTNLLSGRHILVVDLGNPTANTRARELFGSTMAAVLEMSSEEHDRVMAFVLGLSHALNIAFFSALADSGSGYSSLSEVSSTTFDAQLDVARRVAEESPDLYFEIQADNAFTSESLDALQRALTNLRSAVDSNDREAFRTLMEAGRRYFETR